MAHPVSWIGAPSEGGLRLPSGTPSPMSLYAPRGVWTDGLRLVVSDTGNHRVLIWHRLPTKDHQPADVVLGQGSFVEEGANSRGTKLGMNLPTGVMVVEGRLVVADAWNHRLLVWDGVPEVSGEAPEYQIGQSDWDGCEMNAGGACSRTSLYWPFGVGVAGGRFWVADTGNRRALCWPGLPVPGQPPEMVLGQPDFVSNEENRGEVGPASFRWVHAIAEAGGMQYFADAGNHRVLVWQKDTFSSAVAALGQESFDATYEWAYGPQSERVLRFPYAVAGDGDILAVADTANNRVLIWDAAPAGMGHPADRVIGQDDFRAYGENHWKEVTHSSMCWPYGLSLAGNLLAVADSGNNRVMLWSVERETPALQAAGEPGGTGSAQLLGG